MYTLRPLRLITMALALAIAPLAAVAQSDLDRHLGPVAGFVQLGQNGAWTSSADANWYTLNNEDAYGEVQYFWASQPSLEGRDFTLSTNLFTRTDKKDVSHAGLLFHYRDGQRYLAVTIASDGGAYILEIYL